MPNIASVLKDEILRLARKEVRKEIESLKKASAQFRSDIATLKRGVATLEKQLARQGKKASKKLTPSAGAEDSRGVRFSSKGFASHRQRLGLSAAEMGELLGVSAQTVYHWESGKTQPRRQQLGVIAAIRGMGKREAKARLASSTPGSE
jgi:DNA-binding transcriptional regulator YiaG